VLNAFNAHKPNCNFKPVKSSYWWIFSLQYLPLKNFKHFNAVITCEFYIKLSSDFIHGSNISTNYDNIILRFIVLTIASARNPYHFASQADHPKHLLPQEKKTSLKHAPPQHLRFKCKQWFVIHTLAVSIRHIWCMIHLQISNKNKKLLAWEL